MASIQRRGGVWRAQVARKGRRVNATFDTRGEAEDWAIRAEAAILAGAPEREAISPITAADLFNRYAREVSPGKRGARWEILRLAALARNPRFQRPVAQIDGPALAEWRDAELLRVSALSVNRVLALISSVFNVARKEWRVAVPNPVSDIQRPRNPPARTRRVSDEELSAVIGQLGWDGVQAPRTAGAWTAYAFAFAIATAMRQGEILAMTWQHVHADYVHLPLTKNGETRDVPLSTGAVAMLGLLPRGEPGDRVVPVAAATVDALFRRARDKLGIVDLHFHDSRREGTTRHAAKLANVLELASVTGHKTLAMLKVYYAPKASDLAKKLG